MARKQKTVSTNENIPTADMPKQNIDHVLPVRKSRAKSKPVSKQVEIIPDPDTIVKSKKTNKWLDHVSEFRKNNSEMSYREALKSAKETYVK